MGSYTVTDTRETVSLTPGANQKSVYRVWLSTSKGATGSIDVNPDDWNETDLPSILEEKAKELDLAFTLTS